MITTAVVPAVAGTVATATGAGEVPFEWRAVVLVLVGVSVLAAIASHLVTIWKMTRPVPPVGEQIQNAIDRHEKAASDRNAEQSKHLDDNFDQIGKDIGRVEKRLDGHDDQFKELWRAVPFTVRSPG